MGVTITVVITQEKLFATATVPENLQIISQIIRKNFPNCECIHEQIANSDKKQSLCAYINR